MNVNFEDKVCIERKEMRVLDIHPDELRKLRTRGCGDEDEDDVRNKPGVEDDMYRNGTWMLNGWVEIRNNNSSSKDVGRGDRVSR